MLQLLVGVCALLAVIFLRDEPRTPRKRYSRHDPWVILALHELDEENDQG